MATPAVNKPTDVRAKEVDIARKLQFFGIASAFKSGKVPSNEQIDVALNSFLSSRAISTPSNKLSPEGQALVGDFRDVVAQARNLVLSKNEGNLLQDFVYQTQQFDPKAVAKPGAPIDKSVAKNDGSEALAGLKTLGTLLITNGQFRKLLKDASTLLRDVAGDAATKAAGKVKPTQEQLSQVDAAAPANTWHDAPDLSKANLKKRMGTDKQADAPVAVEGEAKPTAIKKLGAKVPDEVKEKAKARATEAKTKTKDYMNQKMPQERRDQVIDRLKKMVFECQSNPDYKKAIETLLNLAEQYTGHATTAGKSGAGSAKQARGNFQKAESSLKTLIERSANGTSTEGLMDSVRTIYKDADNDPELKGWFRSINAYIRRCLQEEGYIVAEASTKDGRALHDQGRNLLRNKYKGHTDQVADEARFLGKQFEEDPQNQAFGQATKRLFTHLGQDADGKPAFKPHLVKDLVGTILPAALAKVQYIPVPRIEYTDSKVDAVIDNVVVESDNFVPNVIEIDSDHAFKFGRNQNVRNFNTKKNTLQLGVKGIQMDIRDVSYHIKKKQGFPSLSDTGVVDIILPGDGLSFKMKMSTADPSDRQHYFKVDKVDVDVSKLRVKAKKSKFKWAINLLQPILMKVLRPVIKKVVEKALQEEFSKMDGMMHEVNTEAKRASQAGEGADADKKGAAARYADIFKKKMLENKEKKAANAKPKDPNAKFNIAMTKEDSIFPNINLPGGYGGKASEYRDLAKKGDMWESPVFALGNAPRSSKLPAAPQIMRKQAPHVTGMPKADPKETPAATAAANDEFAVNGTAAMKYANGAY